ncbi:MAG: hypothetical protein JJU00_05490 [Opitutales bacterium]|nr:hypothetical protein [Opitutales bacterium]
MDLCLQLSHATLLPLLPAVRLPEKPATFAKASADSCVGPERQRHTAQPQRRQCPPLHGASRSFFC